MKKLPKTLPSNFGKYKILWTTWISF